MSGLYAGEGGICGMKWRNWRNRRSMGNRRTRKNTRHRKNRKNRSTANKDNVVSKGIDAGVVYFTLNIDSSCVWLF